MRPWFFSFFLLTAMALGTTTKASGASHKEQGIRVVEQRSGGMLAAIQQADNRRLRGLEDTIRQRREGLNVAGAIHSTILSGSNDEISLSEKEVDASHHAGQQEQPRHLTLPGGEEANPSNPKDRYTFAVVPKQLIEFFKPTQEGCKDHAARLSKQENITVECLYVGPSEAADRGIKQAQMVEHILWGKPSETRPIDGLAVSVVDETLMAPILDRARQELKIPVVTFDSDAPESTRSYYIGTNNSFFGRQLGRQMESLKPMGGTFGIISGESTNLQERANGIIQELIDQTANSDTTWTQLPDSPFDALNNQTLALEKMDQWAQQNPTVLLSVTGLPMRIQTLENGDEYAPWVDFVDQHRHRNITHLCADASPHQLTFLNYDYVNGLAGQLPYDMGIKSVDTLWTLYHNPETQLGDSEGSDFIGTNVVWHVHIPLKLPPVTVDTNRVGHLQYVGYTLFGVVAAFAIGLSVWLFLKRKVRILQVGQPIFLVMIAVGVLIMASSMIPVGMDDLDVGGPCTEDDNSGHCRAICMAIPWTASIGFVLIFSSMWVKHRRINAIFETDAAFARVKVPQREALPPLLILMTINVTILVCWTLLDPLTYHRQADHSRDEWNRVISTYGQCQSQNAAYFMVPLLLVNFGVLLLANWQSYQARKMEQEFAETKYIAICMASMLQAMISGFPLLFFVHDMPQAYYMVYVLLCFIISMVILLVMFVPKVFTTYEFEQLSPNAQQEYMTRAIRRTTRSARGLRNSGSSRSMRSMSIRSIGISRMSFTPSSLHTPSSRSAARWLQPECQMCAARSRVESQRSSKRLSWSDRTESSEDVSPFGGSNRTIRGSIAGRRPSMMRVDENDNEDETSTGTDREKKLVREVFPSTAANCGDSVAMSHCTEIDSSNNSMQLSGHMGNSARRLSQASQDTVALFSGLETVAGSLNESSSENNSVAREEADEKETKAQEEVMEQPPKVEQALEDDDNGDLGNALEQELIAEALIQQMIDRSADDLHEVDKMEEEEEDRIAQHLARPGEEESEEFVRSTSLTVESEDLLDVDANEEEERKTEISMGDPHEEANDCTGREADSSAIVLCSA